MGIVTKQQFEKHEPVTSLFESHDCFYCGEDFFNSDNSTGGIVYWHGMTVGMIGLHQACAEKLAVNMIQDARSLVSQVGKRSKLRHEKPVVDKTTWFSKKD